MESIVAVLVLAFVAVSCVGTLAFMAVRMAYALTSLTSKESAEVLSDMVKPVRRNKRQAARVEVPPDMANPVWSTTFAKDMTDVADPNRSGVT
jgi:hypothetical protein